MTNLDILVITIVVVGIIATIIFLEDNSYKK